MGSAVFQAAMEYARLGWQVVPVYGTNGAACQCANGANCKSPGKHPRLKEWQKQASTDEETIGDWLTKWPETNIGVRLGPESRIIDIEFDNDEGRKLAERILAECYTPTFESARSVHRLFRWYEGLPRKTVPKVGGLECRLGQDDRGAQTVFPPSRHASGVSYRWKEGLSPSEVEVADIPDALLSLLVNQEDHPHVNGYAQSAQLQRFIKAEKISSGQRNELLHVFACHEWRKAQRLHLGKAFNEPTIEQEVWNYVWVQNLGKCVPPLEMDEVLKLFRSARDFIAKSSSSESVNVGSQLTRFGLDFRDGEWWPGLWSIEVHEGHEAMVRLIMPEHVVVLPMEAYLDHVQVQRQVLCQTQGKICLDLKPRFWATVWNGRCATKGDGGCEGLKVKLLQAAKFIEPTIERKREYMLADFVIASVRAELQKCNPTAIDQRTKQFKDHDGGTWFKFNTLMQEAANTRFDVTRNELSAFLRANGVVDKAAGPADGRSRFLFADKESWAKIIGLANN